IAYGWNDRLLISKDSVFNPDAAVVVGSVGHSAQLQADSSYSGSAVVTLPEDASGLYYLYVQTDWNNRVFESTFEQNNISRSTNRVAVTLSPWPDLAVTQVIAPSAERAGDRITLALQVTNSGSAGTPARGWTDSVFLSA